jgi:hypothetical protein
LPNLRDSNRLPGVFIIRFDYEYEKLQEYSKKIKIVSGHAYWDKEKLFDEKKPRRKIPRHFSFNANI